MYVCISYNTSKSALPDIYAQCLRAHSFHSGLGDFSECLKWYILVITQALSLPDIYAQCLSAHSARGRVRIYQAKRVPVL